MHEAHRYKGHSIDLDLRELQPGRTQCTYFIDAVYCFESAMKATTVENARESAIAQAHASIDALDSLTTACSARDVPRPSRSLERRCDG